MLVQAQAQVGLEQYCYVKNKQMTTLVPIFNYESPGHLYLEGRYNYEEDNTLSFYVGKSFSNSGNLKYAITPILGGVVGKFKGISSGLNAVIEYRDLFFSTQSQYTVSFIDTSTDFLFSWSEVGYQPWKWFYLGVTAQQTYMPQSKSLESEPGVFVGFTAGMLTFPLYMFKPMSTSNYFVLGVNLSMDGFNRNR